MRLFDKGEMNTYRDEVPFINTVSSHLTRLLPSILFPANRNAAGNTGNQATDANEFPVSNGAKSEILNGNETDLQSREGSVMTQQEAGANQEATDGEVYTNHRDIFMITDGLERLGLSEKRSNIRPNHTRDLATIELSDTCKEQLLAFVSNRFCSVAEELCSRLEWINVPQLSDAFLKQAEFQGDGMYILRKLTVLRVLFGVLRDCTELDHPDVPLPEVFLLAEKVRELLVVKFREETLNVGQVMLMEVTRFYSLV